MASPSPRYRYRCEICGEPIGMFNEGAHWRSVHPEVMAVQRRATRKYGRVYMPLSMAFLVVAMVSIILQAWWWRLGFLLGIYGMFATLLVFGVREWSLEKPVRLAVISSCPVCDARMPIADMRRHVEGTHPDIFRLVKQSYWLLNPGIFAVLAYTLVLLSVMVTVPLPDWVWNLVPVLLMGPIGAWMAVLVIVGVVLDRTRLQPARKAWRILHP